MLISIPVFMPIILNLGIDPIWFCILILVQLELAGITPPFGVLLFVMKGVQQHLRGFRDLPRRDAHRADPNLVGRSLDDFPANRYNLARADPKLTPIGAT